MKLRLSPLLLALALAACVRTPPNAAAPDAGVAPPPPPPPPPVAARTTIDPPPGPFNGSLTVTLTTDKAATLLVTRDGSDPRTSATAVSLPAPASFELQETTTLAFFSRTAEGAEEETRSAEYPRAGGPIGTISGVVVVGELAAGHPVLLDADGQSLELSGFAEEGEIPFVLEGLSTGAHRLAAFADRNADGIWLPVVDLRSETFEAELDLADPYRASLEGVRILLAESQPGLCTLRGTVTFSAPVPGQTLMVAAFDPGALGAEGGLGGLFEQLNAGYKVVTNETDTVYPYVITDLEPGTWLPVPALANLGGGLALNLIASATSERTLAAGQEAVAHFEFGSVSLAGTATLETTETPFLAYGVVAARNLSLMQMSIQAVLMPTLFMGAETGLVGNFAGRALRDGGRFDVRAFSSLDPVDPFSGALGWVLNPFAPDPPHASFTATPPEVRVDFVAAPATPEEPPPAP